MAIYKCKACAGSLNITEDQTTVTCDYCGTQQALPKSNTDLILNLYDRANHFRRNNEFDKAEKVYQQILIEDPSDAEAYWSLVLCSYGIEYVEDPKTRKRIPTVNRAQFTSIYNNENYKKALEHGDGYQKNIFESEAKVINEIQKGILSISQKEEPYDVFISYKETDEQGKRTRDSVLGNDLYHQLTKEGFKVFFSRITLESKLGMEYEPYIFAALNSAKVMVVLGTKQEYFNAVWVKNEWSRFLSIVRDSKGEKILIPAYRDMDPYDLPEEFSHLQAQDMSKLGFMQDLIRGIKKILEIDKPQVVKETVIGGASNNVESLLNRGYLYLEEKNWEEADEYFERVLDIDHSNLKAYLGKLLAEIRISSKDNLIRLKKPFNDKQNYDRILRFDPNGLGKELKDINIQIDERNKLNYYQGQYDEAQSILKAATTSESYRSAANILYNIKEFKDSRQLADKANEKSKELKIQEEYNKACRYYNSTNVNSLKEAISIFTSLKNYKDSYEKLEDTKRKLQEVEKLELKAKKKRTRNFIIVLASIIVVFIAGFTINNVIKNNKPAESFLEFRLLNDNTYAVTGYKGNRKELIIPEYYNGKKITVIGYSAFEESRFKSITIPKYVTKIDNWAFSEAKVNYIYFSENSQLQEIEMSAFNNTKSLKHFKFPENIQELDSFLFTDSNVRYIIIPENIIRIRSWPFEDTKANLYIEHYQQPDGWYKDRWKDGNEGKIYWGNEWYYDSKGNPKLK